jgi:dUTP pyrophosphatase
MIPLGIASQFKPGWVAHVWDRSGMGKKGIKVLAGVIDSDYRGEWRACLINLTGQSHEVKKGDRVAQVVFVPCYIDGVKQVSAVRESDRGTSGWGSTGR